jgi:uncharacterized protein
MNIKGVTDAHMQVIFKSIKVHLPNAKVYAFGSRVSGTPRQYSDLDIALDNGQSIDISDIAKIKETLENTDLPIQVDMVDYHSISESFRAIVYKEKAVFSV